MSRNPLFLLLAIVVTLTTGSNAFADLFNSIIGVGRQFESAEGDRTYDLQFRYVGDESVIVAPTGERSTGDRDVFQAFGLSEQVLTESYSGRWTVEIGTESYEFELPKSFVSSFPESPTLLSPSNGDEVDSTFEIASSCPSQAGTCRVLNSFDFEDNNPFDLFIRGIDGSDSRFRGIFRNPSGLDQTEFSIFPVSYQLEFDSFPIINSETGLESDELTGTISLSTIGPATSLSAVPEPSTGLSLLVAVGLGLIGARSSRVQF